MSTRKDALPIDPFAACKLAKERAGGSRILGPMLGITRQAVDAWKVVPYKHARRVSLETGISCHVLRPDIFGPAPEVFGPALTDTEAAE